MQRKIQPPLRTKLGEEYWLLLEKTARRVENWPEWKTGKSATRKIEQTNQVVDKTEASKIVIVPVRKK